MKNNGCSDSIRILLQQLACVLVEYASHYLNTSKSEGNRLRILMEFVWPCLSGKKCTDSITEYHGHLLLCHIISKMAIHKKIILQGKGCQSFFFPMFSLLLEEVNHLISSHSVQKFAQS